MKSPRFNLHFGANHLSDHNDGTALVN